MKLEFSESALVAITNYHRLDCLNKQTNKMLISQAGILRSGSQHGGVLGESLPSGLESSCLLAVSSHGGKGPASSPPEALTAL